jgi:hypothetical protein
MATLFSSVSSVLREFEIDIQSKISRFRFSYSYSYRFRFLASPYLG